ncbi:hypothetical protein [Sphingomonas sp. CLY1604]|uniref:hypothetical protein n=1 Tax=Sphingomonas sp. CLY1604 TaxID=3457786 RepID=UPI003FD6F906
MSDPSKPDPAVDPGRQRHSQPFDADDGLYGQEYHRDREAAQGRDLPSGTVAAKPGAPARTASGIDTDADIPPDNGRRASFDPRTGAVHGSGSGAGGGNPGEDFASDAAGGDGYPITGAEGTPDGAPDDLGPPHFKQ